MGFHNSSHFLLTRLQSYLATRSRSIRLFRQDSAITASSNKMKILNVAEKNDAAKSIANVMARGAALRREGLSKYNKIYQFDYMLQGQQVTMNMTSVSGHLQDVEFGGQYKSWKSCSPLALFDAPLIKFVPEKFQPIKRTLEREAHGAHKLIIWTDCDREGESIGFEIIDVVTQANPRIQVLRAKFSEITANSINRAIANLVPPDTLQNDAVEVRRELDLRIGAAFTRFLTLRYQTAFPELADMVISYGSCQFPTLGFVVERYKQIQEFIAEPFWKLSTTLEEEGKKVTFNWKRVRLFDYDAVRALYDVCIEEPMATVADVKKKSKSKWRPVALDTVEFEKHMSRKLKMSAKRAMQIAEKLYTSGFISYPRTETNKFPRDFNLQELVQHQTADPAWGDFAGRLMQEGITPRNGNKSDEAHPPIHPTKHAPNLNGEEKKVYEFIVRHFLACCSKDAKGFETTVEIDIAGEKFTASGLVILERNYLEVYPYEKWSDKDIPDFNTGDCYQPDSIQIQSGETSPPNLLTEADLIALMEKHGIGTDATHAEHIEKIQERSYAGVQDHKFLPGKLGMGLVEGYDALGFEFSKPYLRAGLENDLKLICEGRRVKEDVLRDQIRTYREKFEVSLQRVADIDGQMQKYLDTQMGEPGAMQQGGMNNCPTVRKCPNCGNEMTLRQRNPSTSDQTVSQPTQTASRKSGYYIGCTGYPQCRSAMWLPRNMLEVKVLEERCRTCGPDTRLLQITFKPGSVPPSIDTDYTGCIMCDQEVKEAFDLILKSSNTNTPNNRPQANVTRDGANAGRAGTNAGRAGTNAGRAGTNAGRAGTNAGRAGTNAGRAGTNAGRAGTNAGRAGANAGRGGSNPTRGGSNTGRGGVTQPPTLMQNNGGITAATDQENLPVCMCAEAAIVLTVRKDSPNQGREFYKCREGKCSFFAWADQPPETARTQRPAGGAGVNGGGTGTTGQRALHTMRQCDDNVDMVSCACNLPANRLTVQKEGANKGREFFTCPKPRGQGCKFFQWADQDPSNQINGGGYGSFGRGGARGGGAGRGGGANRGRGGGASRGGGGKRKCGQCREEGHTKKTCPQLQ